jgi:hypothetical protein
MLTSWVERWLRRPANPRVLHVFDQACNLVNGDGQIISLVKIEVGPGPFAIVVPFSACFTQYIDSSTLVLVENGSIRLGSLSFETDKADLWQPRPPWARHVARRDRLLSHLPVIAAGTRDYIEDLATTLGPAGRRRFSDSADLLIQGMVTHDAAACRKGAAGLAGLGTGLTPTGDDFLVGATYALWATRPAAIALELANVMVETAVPRTTSLSAAWLEAAGRGEAAEPWHSLLRAVEQNEGGLVARAVERILATGHGSGAEALAGFSAGLLAGNRLQ